jgi:Fur family transcriptional regulator, ferric uptake regulator
MHQYYEQDIIETLKKSSVHITQNRVAVLKLLKESNNAQSVSGLVKLSTTPLDRISVYRTLQYFLKKRMVLLVPNNDRDAKYILAEDDLSKKLDDKQSFFVCTCCKLTEIIMLPFTLPNYEATKYEVSKFSLILEGLCANCK